MYFFVIIDCVNAVLAGAVLSLAVISSWRGTLEDKAHELITRDKIMDQEIPLVSSGGYIKKKHVGAAGGSAPMGGRASWTRRLKAFWFQNSLYKVR